MTADCVVVDTSVLISAVLSPGGKPAAVVDWVLDHKRFVFSQPTFEELATRIMRPKCDRYVSIDERQLFLKSIAEFALWAEITGDLKASRDPADDMFLETALRAGAEFVVTGDNDLLVLDPFQGIRIVTAAMFLARLS
jgi:uncharacterized protein